MSGQVLHLFVVAAFCAACTMHAMAAADGVVSSPDAAAAELLARFEALEKHVREQDKIIRDQQEAMAHQQREIEDQHHEMEHHDTKIRDQQQAMAHQQQEIEEQHHKVEAQDTQIQKLETSTRRLSTADLAQAADHSWFILCGALVMLMQAGFACVEAGCCRMKNVQSIMLKNLIDVCIGTLGWYSFGYAFAMGGPDNDNDGYLDGGFIGHNFFFGGGFFEANDDGVQRVVDPTKTPKTWFFQWAFCATAATIVSGGVAERVNLPAYATYSFIMTAFIYPVVVAWTWGYGWLADINDVGYMDFAGSGIVHMTGGVGALVGAIIAGPRTGRFDGTESFAPHSLPLIVLGTFILWFGWYGFNCGSTLGMSTAERGVMASQVAMNTTLSAAVCGLVVLALRYPLCKRKYDVGAMCNGILAGLVSITAGCGNVENGSALAIGAIGGFVYVGSSLLLRWLRIDDPMDAFSVHGACGAWGVLAAALFDWGKGFDHVNGWNGFDCMRGDAGACKTGLGVQLLAANCLEIIMVFVWVGGLSALIFLPMRLAGFLRADDSLQESGMDQQKHSPAKAYNIS